MIRQIAILSFWIFLALAGVVLFYFGAKAKGYKVCSGVNIEIGGNAKQIFIDENAIKTDIRENGGSVGIPTNSIDLRKIESQIKKEAWVESAKVYFDNHQILQVHLAESVPVARIFTLNNNSFFIDSNAKYLPLNDNIAAQVPVFTGFSSDKQKPSPRDSALLQDVRRIAGFIISDTFWTAFTAQINILPDARFQIIPVVGNQIINIGNADNLPDKFNRIYSFYKEVLTQTGINKYKIIDVQYDGQVVASAKNIDSTALYANDTIQRNFSQ